MFHLLKYGLLLCSAATAVTAQYTYGSGSGSGSGSNGGNTNGSPTTMASNAATATNGVHTVTAGENGFVYSPDTLHVPPGEKVEFHFFPPNHSVAQASFDNPCHPMSQTSFWSGFFQTPSAETNMIFTLTVNNTDPIWMYCPILDDCQLGMVAVINPPSSGQTLDQFRAAAKKASKSTHPAMIQGGIISSEKASSSSSASATPSSDAPVLRAWTEVMVILGLSVAGATYVM